MWILAKIARVKIFEFLARFVDREPLNRCYSTNQRQPPIQGTHKQMLVPTYLQPMLWMQCEHAVAMHEETIEGRKTFANGTSHPSSSF